MDIDFDQLNERERYPFGGRRTGKTFHMLVKAVWMADFTAGPIYMRFGDIASMQRCMALMIEIANELGFERVKKVRGVKLQINDTIYVFDFAGFGMSRRYGYGEHFTHEFIDHWEGPVGFY